MSMVKKQDNGFDLPPLTDAGRVPPDANASRLRDATPSGVKLAAAALARPLPTNETLPKPPGDRLESPHKSGVAPSELGRALGRQSLRRPLPERPELSASDVEWWAESALNATFEPSRVVPIEQTTDPNEGDRITPVFLESITPVFPESKVREVMALADERERSALAAKLGASAKANLPATVKPPPSPVIKASLALPPPPPAPPLPGSTGLAREPVEGAGIWNVPVLDAPPSPAPPKSLTSSMPVPSASHVESGARPVPRAAGLPEPGTLHFGRPPRDAAPASFKNPNADSSDQLHAVSFALAGSDVAIAIWIAVAIILIMVAAAMFTVG
ncbi:hypothetical protein [Pendulispora albinea]|uniref:Uncharacterized protein n=1 Tax=Pendulispora albinea TaxID=2741071 RepID=A0ABZ2LZN7_9BACT